MFYSQFILAKKGPLGTIWIAAHLERKLRKNQVADTDIGVSVDSILFPEVPIALRLSSHLLLGVVRIYSRKVNYLFDDCSEALLKIKQAFRSTAVDLPPEESTAPYHSITLPETFDLDDFELPDNEIFQGNYVDHHVSTREQITLQDAMEGVVYSTSQFGLDERFGDGDTSQIGLDFDEDLFIGQAAAEGNDGISGSDPQALAPPTKPLEKHEEFEGVPGTSETVQMNGTGNQAPSTPVLFEEPNLSSVQEPMACNDHLDLEDHNLSNLPVPEGTEKACSEFLCCEDDNAIIFSENRYNLGELEMKEMMLPVNEQINPVSPALKCSNGTVGALDLPNRVEDINTGIVINSEPTMLVTEKKDEQCGEPAAVGLDETIASPSCSQVTSELEESARKISSSGTCVREPEDNMVDQQTSIKSEIQNHIAISNDRGEAHTPNIDVDSFDPVAHEKMATAQLCVLQACNSHPNHYSFQSSSDKSAEKSCNLSSEVLRLNSVDNAISCDNQPDDLDRAATSHLLPPEKFLSKPEGLTAEPSGLPVDSTPEKEVFGDGVGTKLISGKKHSYTESTVTVQSLNSVESFGEARGKRTADSIPDDDDLLSSILVGRRSSVLKLKPTPPVSEMKTTKRSRTAVRSTVSKRKVLMDDTMVLHGDIIRQQLTNTEDIRRVRKKAPCTRPEISMIQRQNLEDEIFIEPIFTGFSAELIYLHTENFDPSRTRFSEDDQDNASDEVLKDVQTSVRSSVTEETKILGSTEPVIIRDDAKAQTNIVIETENGGMQDHNLRSQVSDAQEQVITNEEKSKHEPLVEMSEMEIDANNAEVTNFVPGVIYDMPYENNILPGLLNKIGEKGTSLQKGTLFMSSDEKLDCQPTEVDISMVDASFQEGVDAVDNVEHNDEIRVDVQTGFSEVTDTSATLGTISLETGDCKNLSLNDQPTEEKGHELRSLNENEVLDATFGCDDEDTKSSCMLGREGNIDSTISLKLDADAKYISSSDKENLQHEEADPRSGIEAEVSTDYRAGNRDYGDLGFGHDTEFLNVDDEEIAEEGDEIPSAEDTCVLENSGWSSRTRAVAKYLQTLFDQEAVHGRKILGMENLLNGKTRKEASRMFFETLVLKTRDYINVEQAKPFADINIKPRVKLMKSDF
ncbi:sister chromatid cohesion 1 protein 4 isoform X2 [Argentina anserina]|uniref:sister chromatid cohesion 1 protein 4 isoform X2 n=1 Tax=Argentina anserina TaxID=57926 RepID=UPI0021769529|nr:sister chromatid cohesion 1 protein 4 isoform X2 [Potentilla anserina]